MATVPPQEVPINLLPIQQGISLTDYLLISNGTLNLVPWSDVVITKDQVDFYTTIESISTAQVELTVQVNTLSATVTEGLSSWDSTYTTVNTLSTGWLSTPTTTLNIIGFIANNSVGYTGSQTPLTNPIVVGFNGSYGANKITDINNTNNYVTDFIDNACLQFEPGTYKFSGTLYSSSGSASITNQYYFGFYGSLPTIGNSKNYSANNAPITTIYSTVSYNASTNTHSIDSYVYISSTCYGALFFTNNDTASAAGTGAGINYSLSIFGNTPKYGGTLNITYLSPTNFLNITGTSSVVAVRPSL